MTKRGSIDRAAVLEAGLRVARRVGLDGLSMRMVAEELGVSAMAAYRHVPSREALVSLVADMNASDIEIPDADSGPWDERLRLLERQAFRAHVVIKGQPDNVVLTWGPNHRRMVDGFKAILADAGFDDEESAVAFEVVWAYFLGQVRIYEHLVSEPDAPHDGRSSDSWPLLTRVLEKAPGMTPEDYFDRGFEILLDGLRAQLERKKPSDDLG